MKIDKNKDEILASNGKAVNLNSGDNSGSKKKKKCC